MTWEQIFEAIVKVVGVEIVWNVQLAKTNLWHYLWRFYENRDYMNGTNHIMNCCNLSFELVIKSRNKLHGTKPKQTGGLVSNRLKFLLKF
jgi:hypothetical protein